MSNPLVGIGLLAVACGLAGCTRPWAPRERDAQVAGATSAPPSAGAPEASPPPDFTELVRARDWVEAAAAFDRQFPSPTEPPLRFVRAKIALEVGDFARVLQLTEGLAATFSEFVPEVAALRASAQVGLGDAAALSYLDKQGDRASGIVAARLLQASGALKEALTRVRTLLAARGAASRQTAYQDLRALHAELLEGLGRRTEAAAEFRWLALNAAAAAGARESLAGVARCGGRPLTRAEHHRRAEALLDAGRYGECLDALDAAGAVRGGGPSEVALMRTRAWAHYKSRKGYEEAARLFSQCAKRDPAHRAQDSFYAARALSRADRDEDALAGYARVLRAYPASGWGQEARYQSARLRYIHGEWAEAVTAYRDYLRRYPRGKHRSEVLHELVVARLALGQGEQALPFFTELRAATRSERLRAVADELRGVALLQAGRRVEAQAAFEAVAQGRPLSFAALMSRARLLSLGATLPPLFPPAESTSAAPSPLVLDWPPKVKVLMSLGLDVDAEAELLAHAADFRDRHGDRGGEALCQAFGELSTARARYTHAQRVVRERVLFRALTEETRWLWECIYPTPYARLVAGREAELQLPQGLVHAVMRQESAFREAAQSPAGAVGLMQIMPATGAHIARELGERFKPESLVQPGLSVRYGSYYLTRLLGELGGSVPLAAAAYNAGPSALKRWVASSGSLPLDLFVAHIPYKETRHYVARVVGNWVRYQYLLEPDGNTPPLALELPRSRPGNAADY